MPRQRTFSEAEALDAAIECFWRDGYEATSVRDLAARMGICGTSLYNAFSDKRSLFRCALERYLDATLRPRIAALEEGLPPKEAVREFLSGVVERALADPERRGCLLVNAALEVTPRDPVLAAFIGERLGEIELFFRRALRRAREEGTLAARQGPDELARIFFGISLGLRVLARAHADRAALEGMLEAALSLLDDRSLEGEGPR